MNLDLGRVLGIYVPAQMDLKWEREMATTQFERDLIQCLPMLKRVMINLCRDGVATEDVVQEVAMRALAHQDKFDGQNLEAWLITIGRNYYRSQWRKEGRREAELTETVIEAVRDERPSTEDTIDAKVALEKTLGALNGSLPLMLAVSDGYQYDELAIKFNVAEGTIKSRINRARAKARAAIGRPLAPEPVKRKPKVYKRTDKWVLSLADRSARIRVGKAKAKATRLARLANEAEGTPC